MKNKMTPGPWFLLQGEEKGPHYVYQVDVDRPCIAQVGAYSHPESPGKPHDDNANAQAIAALPDIISVLMQIESDWIGERMSLPLGRIDEIRAALKKAGVSNG